jgi:uncharacterized ion transporter superfamily protein YfcC
MKNKNLWLSLLIFIGVVFLATWVIPSANYSDSGILTYGAINPTGIWDVLYYIPMLIAWFGQNIIYISVFGIFYGVLSKSGAFRVLVDKIASRFKKNEKMFLLISSSFFIIVASLTGINFPLLVFVPLFMGVILTLGFNKITALIATVVSILVGIMGSLYPASLYASMANYIDAGITYGWYKLVLIILGLLTVGIYLLLTAKVAKGKDKEQIDEDMLFISKTEGPKKQKTWPLITVFALMFVLFVLGFTPWGNMFGFTGFTDLHTKLMDVKIGNFAIFKSVLGASIPAFGTWDITDASALLLLATLIIILIYKINWKDVYEGIVSGVTKLFPTMILITITNLVFVLSSQSGILNAIIKAITTFPNIATASIASFVGAAFVNESYITGYVTSAVGSVLGESTKIPLLLLIQQITYGLSMIVAPTSAILLVGLSYLEVEYKKWMKKIWIPALILTAISAIVITLATTNFFENVIKFITSLF